MEGISYRLYMAGIMAVLPIYIWGVRQTAAILHTSVATEKAATYGKKNTTRVLKAAYSAILRARKHQQHEGHVFRGTIRSAETLRCKA